ncbi:MAG: TM0106 family RecB-like putative nuclease [Propionibacterium sp.]|nr:TM0106 family RecB-like putative nuclease [Propionibacterium sp.]
MILLDPYAARSCPVKTFNAFDPTTAPALPMDESLREAFGGGSDHRDRVLDLLADVEGAVDLRRARSVEATRAAVASGATVIVGPSLPDDVPGHRRGNTDGLIRDPGAPEPRYWPVRSKPYRVVEKQMGGAELRFSSLAAPARLAVLTDRRYRLFREGSLLELAHSWRMLQAAGWAADEERAGIVGDNQDGSTPSITWVQLTTKFIRTYSKTAGYKLRSPLERYDHEHGFRVHVAEVASVRTGVDDPEPVVRPIRVKECEWCAWWSICRTRMDDDDLSLRIAKAPLDVRELQTLLSLGIMTVAQLAEADIDAILPQYLPLTGHRDRAEARLRQAARRARMLAHGVELERISVDPIGVERAEVDVDFDIETADNGSTYLWGALVSGPGRDPEYVPFVRFTHLTGADEVEVAADFCSWLLELVERHPGLRVYHYSDYEIVHLRRIADRSEDPAIAAALALVPEHFVDLYRYTRDNFVGVDGLGLKVVATRGAGFAWRDEDPGGLQSQEWFNTAVDGADEPTREAARRRVLEYNEDDVRATLAVREWLTRQDAGATAG